MGVVYKAFDPHIERTVALKTIHKDLLRDNPEMDLIARFKNEAQAAGRLSHPNIVAVYEYGESEDTAYIAMEFVNSMPLTAWIPTGRLNPLEAVISWTSQLLKALEYAHTRGVVHRDIKPDNLLIDRDGQLKITDFGIARIEASTLTHVGALVGTPCYMSPEQFRGEVADRRSDIFAVGVLLYQMLTGVRPFVGNSFEIMHKITNDAPLNPSAQNPELGESYDALILKAIAKQACDRFDSAQAFLDALLVVYKADRRFGKSSDGAVAEEIALYPQAPMRSNLDADQASEMTSVSFSDQPWKREIVPELESMLLTHVGPMAKVFLKKHAAQASSLDVLCDSLMQHIPTEKGRANFTSSVQLLKKKLRLNSSAAMVSMLAQDSAAAVVASKPGAPPGRALDQALIDNAELRLTTFIGPIAKIVCKRAARQTQDSEEFYRLIAANITAEPERLRFLRDCWMDG